MKKFLLFFIVMFLWISSVHAQTPTIPTESSDVDGLFGKYFARMVKPCQNADEVVIGFNNVAGNFGKIVCEKIANILGNIPGWSTVNIGNGNGNIHVVVNGKITQTEKPNESEKTSVVTIELLEEILKKRVPRVEVGTDTVPHNGRMFIRFKKRFDTKPLVIAMPVGYNYSNRCRGDSFNWSTVVNPTDIKEDGFYVEKINRGGCGGSTQNWGISYVAVTNVDNITTNYLAGVTPEHVPTEEVENSSVGAFKYRSKIDARECQTYVYTYEGGQEWGTSVHCYWFENFNKTFTITPDRNTLNVLIPLSNPKKVILRANGEREAGDWPGSEVYVFCEWGEWCLSFGDEHKVWDFGNNHLWFTVNINNEGIVTVRYRAHDWSPSSGGANFIAETFY